MTSFNHAALRPRDAWRNDDLKTPGRGRSQKGRRAYGGLPTHARKVSEGHVSEQLLPALRETAHEMAGGDWRRVNILSPSRFEVLDPDTA